MWIVGGGGRGGGGGGVGGGAVDQPSRRSLTHPTTCPPQSQHRLTSSGKLKDRANFCENSKIVVCVDFLPDYYPIITIVSAVDNRISFTAAFSFVHQITLFSRVMICFGGWTLLTGRPLPSAALFPFLVTLFLSVCLLPISGLQN